MKKSVAVLCAALVLAGCGQVHRVDITAVHFTAAEINAKAVGRLVTIDLDGGERREVTGFRIEGTTATWRDYREPGGIAAVPVSDLRSVRMRGTGRRVGQTLAGVGVGLIVGGVAGSLLLDVPEPGADIGESLGRGLNILLFALAGGFAGGKVGSSLETEEVFEFTP
jgi:hypothetical protein